MIFRTLIIFCIFISCTVSLYSQRTKSSLSAGEQRHAERSLKNARYFIEFLDSTVSNSGTDEEKNLFIEAVRRDTISRILYMKFAFHDSFTETKKSHIIIIQLLQKLIARETSGARELLNDFAREVFKSGISQSKKYIALGYRSLKWSEKTGIMADNFTESNYSIRIYEYITALKRAKYAKRYAILAIIHCRIEPWHRLKADYGSFDKIQNYINKYLSDMKDKITPIHRDNYYMLNNTSQYKYLINSPGLEEIPEYKEYLRKL